MTESEDISDGRTYRFSVPEDMMVCFIRLLKRGPIWTAEKTPEVERLQAEHVAYGRRLIVAGKLILNGPMLDDGDLRGVGVFRVGSLAEAQVLSDADPAVMAGRLISEVHPWMIFKGILPE
ncbi:MAG TPA: YciI family protein [Ktedonobacterales bacterium]|nr:YciI family protein [Ktedonobacterales bacterium]